MEQLAENVLNVPRPVVLKLLFATYIILYPFKPSFTQIAESADSDQIVKYLKDVFNSKCASGENDGLVKRMISFDASSFKPT